MSTLLKKPVFWPRALVWLALSALMSAVVWLYQRPDMLIMLSEQLWTCF